MDKELSQKELAALVSLLDDEDTEVRTHVREKIMSLGSPIIPFLEKKWEESFNATFQKQIEELVHDLQFKLVKERLSIWGETGGIDLLEGIWLLNTYQYPDLELETLQKELEQLYYDAWLEFNQDLQAVDKIRVLNSVVFNKLKFSANTKNFHAPGNSMLHVVLETRRGNPISLCVVYMLIAQKLKLPVYGVNLPNLFVLTYKTEDQQFYINAFNKGLIFSKADIANYLGHLRLDTKDKYFEPCTHIDIVARMLRNLYISFEKLGDSAKMEEVIEMLRCLGQGLES
ncbi:transglutaminase-like domain-containing protein [Penaeicola halotolerans]|uniref:transglutaminase-like domain-containing protein n=1 Tax=Penaeicola halotolerans TaxID=2793196 RepID=UPI001CF8C832|nr:transglutaminase-like domain-containing protein [Penaeicola halotolerans]